MIKWTPRINECTSLYSSAGKDSSEVSPGCSLGEETRTLPSTYRRPLEVKSEDQVPSFGVSFFTACLSSGARCSFRSTTTSFLSSGMFSSLSRELKYLNSCIKFRMPVPEVCSSPEGEESSAPCKWWLRKEFPVLGWKFLNSGLRPD